MISSTINSQDLEKNEADFPFLVKFVYSGQKEHAVILFYKTREGEDVCFTKEDYLGIVLLCTDNSYKVGDYKFYDTKYNIFNKKKDSLSGFAYYEILDGSITLKNT